MPNLRTQDFTSNLLALLTETFESPPEPFSIYLDQGAGLFNTIEQLSAAGASRASTRGTSIAAQVEHLRFYLDIMEQFMNGRAEKVDWAESWRVREVTPEAWSVLKQDLQTTYASFNEKLKSVNSWDDDTVGDGLAALIHSAYHLGAIRQMLSADAT